MDVYGSWAYFFPDSILVRSLESHCVVLYGRRLWEYFSLLVLLLLLLLLLLKRKNTTYVTHRKFKIPPTISRKSRHHRIFNVARITEVITKSTKAKSICGQWQQNVWKWLLEKSMSLVCGRNRSGGRMTVQCITSRNPEMNILFDHQHDAW